MTTLLLHVLPETVTVVFLVFVMMLAVDLLNVWTRGRIPAMLRGAHRWRQYVIAPAVAAVPGCIGGFTVVSLYVHGMISFGALTGAMLAASGDEAFVLLALVPKTAVMLFLLLAVLGAFFGWITDALVKRFRIRTCDDCAASIVHPVESGIRHYLVEHVWQHIIRRHLWKVALWTFGALLLVEIGMQNADLQGLASRYPLTILVTGALIGLIPESGPHLIIVSLFASGLVPFSVLLTSSIVQDGHSMLPMLAHSVSDSMKLKAFNLVFGLTIGLSMYAMGW